MRLRSGDRFAFGLAALLLAGFAGAGEPVLPQYRFERQWPALERDTYFNVPTGVAVLADDSIVVVDSHNSRLVRLNPSGATIGSRTISGATPIALALGANGELYVSRVGEARIDRYSQDLEPLGSLVAPGTGTDQLSLFVSGLAAAPTGEIYVLDHGNARILRFSAGLVHEASWAYPSVGEGPHLFGLGIDVGPDGSVYVADVPGDRVRVFDRDGTPLGAFGTSGDGDGQFDEPYGIAVDADGLVYVTDSQNDRVQKFTADGTFLAKWGTEGFGTGLSLETPKTIDVGPSGALWLVEQEPNSLVRFTRDGEPLSDLRSGGAEPGTFLFPNGATVDASGRIYVANSITSRVDRYDAQGRFQLSYLLPFSPAHDVRVRPGGEVLALGNDRVFRYDPDGTLLGTIGDGPGSPPIAAFRGGLALMSNGDLLVASYETDRVLHFDAAGEYLGEIGAPGLGDGQFDGPSSIAIDSQGFLYIGDSIGMRLQKFTPTGTYVATLATGIHQSIDQLAFDSQDRLYLAALFETAIRVFDTDGNDLGRLFERGSAPGQISGAQGVAIGPSGELVVVDARNARVMRYLPTTVTADARAVIVAGGGAFPGNSLWPATQANANFAYRALAYQGYGRSSIAYLSDDTSLDLDQNGLADDVSGKATVANVTTALTGAFTATTNDLLLYLVDHGGTDTFRISATETLTAAALDAMLDAFQAAHPTAQVTIVYDACRAASFLDELAGPNRLVLSSTGAGEGAYFVSNGALSFSSRFFSGVLNGMTVRDAFVEAGDATTATFDEQVPEVDANGNGVGNEPTDRALLDGMTARYIGSGIDSLAQRPEIASVSSPQTVASGSTATVTAFDVTDSDGVDRVWAVLRPPGYALGDSIARPIQDLPELDFAPAGDGDWAVTHAGFTSSGTYDVAVYAQDRLGNTAAPRRTAVTIGSPLRRRAVIVVGGEPADAVFASNRRVGNLALAALVRQGYGEDGTMCAETSCDDVRYLVNDGIPGADGTATLANVEAAIATFGTTGVQDLTVFVAAERVGANLLRLGSGATLDAAVLDGWLDAAQATVPGVVTVVVESRQAVAFVQALSPVGERSRVLVASGGTSGNVMAFGAAELSFSGFLWTEITNGATLGNAYSRARASVRFLGSTAQSIQPGLDDSGNAVVEEPLDGRVAQRYTVGAGVLLAGDPPVIATLTPPTLLNSADAAPLVVDGVTSSNTIDTVKATLEAADGGVTVVALANAGGGRWTGTIGPVAAADLPVALRVYAVDVDGAASSPVDATLVDRLFGAGFE